MMPFVEKFTSHYYGTSTRTHVSYSQLSFVRLICFSGSLAYYSSVDENEAPVPRRPSVQQ
jgi:hypothetical protein